MADTLVSTLYPPEITTFQPAFEWINTMPITFSLSAFNSIKDINFIHVSIVDNQTNENVLQNFMSKIDDENSGTFYGIANGIFYTNMPKNEGNPVSAGCITYNVDKDKYRIDIPIDCLKSTTSTQNHWKNNRYYKVQIRFDSSETIDSKNNHMYTNREFFSEWSEVTLIKSISSMSVSFVNINDNTEKTNPFAILQGFFRISGSISFTDINEQEHLKEYYIQIYEKTEEEDVLFYNSDIIYAVPNYSSNDYEINSIIDLNDAKINSIYLIKIILITNNNYKKEEKRYIVIKDYDLNYFTDNDTYKWNNGIYEDFNKIYVNDEDGCAVINFYYQSEPKNSQDSSTRILLNKGICYIYRSCSKDNFKKREIIYRYEYSGGDSRSYSLNFSFEDYTICSLYKYKYYAQYEDIVLNQWSKRHESAEIYPKFYDMLLMRHNRQIAIRYDGQISSWKPTINRQKIDTLGGRYPKFVENASMNYKTFEISGIISAETDYNRKFLSEFDDYYNNNITNYEEEFGNSYLIRNDTYADKNLDNSQTNLSYEEQLFNQHDSYPHKNWYWEREFREELVNWLNDGYPKLYRSMPEGNIPVMIMDVSLTPKTELGRMIYDFSATLYEVGDGYSLEDLERLNIINIPELSNEFIDKESGGVNTYNLKTGFGQYYISKTNNSDQIFNTLEQRIYSGTYFNRTIEKDSFRLKNVKIQFTTPPHYYYYDTNENKWSSAEKILSDNSTIEESSLNTLAAEEVTNNNNGLVFDSSLEQNTETKEPILWLGYIVYLTNFNDNDNEKAIFVNEKGYYQVPNDISITDIKFEGENDIAVINYDYVYTETKSKNQDDSFIISINNILGQIQGIFHPNENISELIYQKYNSIRVNKNKIINKYVDTIQNLNLDITPYSLIEITYDISNDNSITEKLYVGRTGVLNFSNDDIKIKDIVTLGHYMVQGPEDEKIYPTLREWEYRVDNNEIEYSSIDSITNPKYNTLYYIDGIYKIYYIDGQWYNTNYNSENSDTTIIADIPIEGMINYKIQIIEKQKVS